jgi:hypothetical protein
LNALVHSRLVHLLDLGYKCRLRLPLFVSFGFLVGHIFFGNFIEINVQLVEDEDEGEEEFLEDDEDDNDLDEDYLIEEEV